MVTFLVAPPWLALPLHDLPPADRIKDADPSHPAPHANVPLKQQAVGCKAWLHPLATLSGSWCSDTTRAQ